MTMTCRYLSAPGTMGSTMATRKTGMVKKRELLNRLHLCVCVCVSCVCPSRMMT